MKGERRESINDTTIRGKNDKEVKSEPLEDRKEIEDNF